MSLETKLLPDVGEEEDIEDLSKRKVVSDEELTDLFRFVKMGDKVTGIIYTGSKKLVKETYAGKVYEMTFFPMQQDLNPLQVLLVSAYKMGYMHQGFDYSWNDHKLIIKLITVVNNK